jgi:hypothetical protein
MARMVTTGTAVPSSSWGSRLSAVCWLMSAASTPDDAQAYDGHPQATLSTRLIFLNVGDAQ